MNLVCSRQAMSENLAFQTGSRHQSHVDIILVEDVLSFSLSCVKSRFGVWGESISMIQRPTHYSNTLHHFELGCCFVFGSFAQN